MTEAHSPARPWHTPRPSADEIRALIAAEVARAPGFQHVALLLAAVAATGLEFAQLVMDPVLPPRARSARAILFLLMVVIGSCLSVFTSWFLVRRGIVLGLERVLAGKLAATFALVFSAGVWAAGRWGTAGSAGWVLLAGALAITAAAVGLTVVVRRRVRGLERRRAELERALGA